MNANDENVNNVSFHWVKDRTKRQVIIQSPSGSPIISILKPSDSKLNNSQGLPAPNKFPNLIVTSGAQPGNNQFLSSVQSAVQQMYERLTNINFPNFFNIPTGISTQTPIPTSSNLEEKGLPAVNLTSGTNNPEIPMSEDELRPLSMGISGSGPSLETLLRSVSGNNSSSLQPQMTNQFQAPKTAQRPFKFPEDIFDIDAYHQQPEPETKLVRTEGVKNNLKASTEVLVQLFRLMSAAAVGQTQPNAARPIASSNTPTLDLDLNPKWNVFSTNGNVKGLSNEPLPIIKLFPSFGTTATANGETEKADIEYIKPVHAVLPILENRDLDEKLSNITKQERLAMTVTEGKEKKEGIPSEHLKLNPEPDKAKPRPVYGYQAAEYKPKEPSMNDIVNELIRKVQKIVFDVMR